MIDTSHSSNYFHDNHHLNSEFNYSFKSNNSKIKFSHRNSFDAGYESILSTSTNSFLTNRTCSSGSNNTNDSCIFSQPSTPSKSNSFIINCNNSTTTPDFKQQYITDVNSIYYASIRSSISNNSAETFLSPIKSSNFGHFSASNSNSPVKLTNSPKFVLNTDNYIHQRDNIKSKLLRSPAFKLNNIITPTYQKPQIKSFNSRFELNYTSLSSPASILNQQKIRPTLTEEEFIELLIKNKHLPSHPEFLIGRRMGLEHIDILTELSKKSMNNIIDQIFDYLNVKDYVRMGCVSKNWRQLVKQNKNVNKQRVEFLKNKKRIYETTKENRDLKNNLSQIQYNGLKPKSGLTLEEKRNLLKNYRMHHSIELSEKEPDANNLIKHSTGSFVFASLDLNCVNNITTGATTYADFNANLNKRSNKKQPRDSDESLIEDIDMLVESESPSKKQKLKLSNEVTNDLFSACNSLIDSINKSQIATKRSTVLVNEFKQISIDEDVKTKANFLNKNESAIQLAENSPKFICKNLKLSPVKKQMSIDSAVNQSKIDLIGSKKSKRNLKRL